MFSLNSKYCRYKLVSCDELLYNTSQLCFCAAIELKNESGGKVFEKISQFPNWHLTYSCMKGSMNICSTKKMIYIRSSQGVGELELIPLKEHTKRNLMARIECY